MGDCQTEPVRPQFDRRLRLEFHGATVTSDAGHLAYRELDDALRLTDTAADELQDTRTGRNTRHSLVALLRQSLFSRRAGYEDLNDAQRLRVDPALRTVVGGRARDKTAASPSEIGSRRSWGGSVGCARRRAPGDRSPWAEEFGAEPRRTGMVCREVRETGRRTSRRGPSGHPDGHPACRPRRPRRFFLDTGMRPVSNACPGEPDEVPDNEVNAHPGNPGLSGTPRSESAASASRLSGI